jgi:hypothetical protein
MYGRLVGKYDFEVSPDVFKDVMVDAEKLHARIDCVARIYSSWHHFSNERITIVVDDQDANLIHCNFYEAQRKIHTVSDTGAEGSHA